MAFALVAQPAPVRCAHCPAVAEDVPTGVPEGWDAVFMAGEWTMTCPGCQVTMDEPVFAVFRPVAQEIGLFVGAAGGFRTCTLSLGEASHLHKTLGQALALAANPGGLP